jgi:hypothetical protein
VASRDSHFVSEAALQRAVWKAVIKRWPTAYIIHPVGGPYQEPGIPDLLLCIEGLFVGIELKNIGPGESHNHAVERTTDQQRRHIRRINAAGGVAGTATSVSEAIDICERAFVKDERRWKEKER